MADHYASADVGRLLNQANLLLKRSGTQTVLRVGDGCCEPVHTLARVPQQEGEDLVLRAKCMNLGAMLGTGG
jgi:hypothetical protein